MDPATVIALCKENIQPLRYGRNATQLGTALRAQEDVDAQQLLLQEKQMYEDAIKNYDGEDPLENWYEYILWVEQSYPKSGHESHIGRLLQQCLGIFEKETKYHQDRRYIRLWINYISMQKNPLELYQLLHNNGIGTVVADTYRAWAFELEQIEDYKRADEVYLMGLSTHAEPYEELSYAHQNFQLAVARKTLGRIDERNDISLFEQRQAFSSLRAIRAGKRVGSIRTGHRVREYHPGVVPQISASMPNAKSNSKIQIYQDDIPGEMKGSSILDHVPIEDTVHKENTIKPGPWNSGHKRGPLIASTVKAGFKIHEDQSDQCDMEKVRLFPNHVAFFDGSKDLDCLRVPVYVADPIDSNIVRKPHYPKELVYVDNVDRSMEEIRAQLYLERRAAQLLENKHADVSMVCLRGTDGESQSQLNNYENMYHLQEMEEQKLDQERREAEISRQRLQAEQQELQRQQYEAEKQVLETRRQEAEQRELERLEAERIEAERLEVQQRMEAELNSQRKLQSSNFMHQDHHVSSLAAKTEEHLLGQSLTVNTKEAISVVQDLWQSPNAATNTSRFATSVAPRMVDSRNKLSFDIHMDSSMTQHAMTSSKHHQGYNVPIYNDQENHQSYHAHHSYSEEQQAAYVNHELQNSYHYQMQQHHEHQVQSHPRHQHHPQQHPQQHHPQQHHHQHHSQQHHPQQQQQQQHPQQHHPQPHHLQQHHSSHIPQHHPQHHPQQLISSHQQMHATHHQSLSHPHLQSPGQMPHHQPHVHHHHHHHPPHHHQSPHNQHILHSPPQHVHQHMQHMQHSVYGSMSLPTNDVGYQQYPTSMEPPMLQQNMEPQKQLHFSPYNDPNIETSKPYRMPPELPYIKSPGMNRKDIKYLESAEDKENAIVVDYNGPLEDNMVPKPDENSLYNIDESLGITPLSTANETCFTEAFNTQLASSTPMTSHFKQSYRAKDDPQFASQEIAPQPVAEAPNIEGDEKLSVILETTREYVSSSSGSSSNYTRTTGLISGLTREDMVPIKEQPVDTIVEEESNESLLSVNHSYEQKLHAQIQAVHVQSPRTVQRNVDQITSEIKNNCDLRKSISLKLNSEQENLEKVDTMDCEEHEPMEQVEEESFELPSRDINPFDKNLIAGLLKKIKFPQPHHADGYTRIDTNLIKLVPSSMITLGTEAYDLEKCLGKGMYGTVFKAVNLQTGETVALKTQRPAWVWEFYIVREIKARLTNPHMLRGFMDVTMAYVTNNGSILVSEYSKFGTLLAVTNQIKIATGKPLVETLAIFFTIEMLQIVEYLHKCQIIHGDIKPDNFLLMRPPTEDVRPTIQLIDFGCSIDMKLLPENTTFMHVIKTEDFTCIEMQTGRPWTYQTDLYCLAATSHCLLFGNYMRVSNISGRWFITSKLPRYAKKAAWEQFFTELLNIESCEKMPDLAKLRNTMEEALAQMPEVQTKFRMFVNILNKR
ncbi:Mitotic checkpoint serine/threonine-protein kinase BUB1 [Ooceraea biroi]|uniref:Mitotic checkpoint serine/threonine-protein kinase BUB1 n=1 Tax=Ooceraea biroi TaxID=2015173 RepID=A0A026W7Z7_OOCBI|nr:Mitotic checkpoint serine/threonine-protein kinase BUB1 [Ooceraea biroi]